MFIQLCWTRILIILFQKLSLKVIQLRDHFPNLKSDTNVTTLQHYCILDNLIVKYVFPIADNLLFIAHQTRVKDTLFEAFDFCLCIVVNGYKVD